MFMFFMFAQTLIHIRTNTTESSTCFRSIVSEAGIGFAMVLLCFLIEKTGGKGRDTRPVIVGQHGQPTAKNIKH